MMRFKLFSVARATFLRPRIILIGAIAHITVLTILSGTVAIPTPSQQAVDYNNLSNIVWGTNQFLALLLPILFLILGSRTRLSTKILEFGKYRTFAALATVFFVLNWLIKLPLERIRTNKLVQTRGDDIVPIVQWGLGQLLGSLTLTILSVLVVLFVYWLINKSPRKWWLWTTGIFSLLILVFLAAEPLTISHNPLGQSPVEVKISNLAEQIGIPLDAIALENCEPFDSCDMAHVSGLGPTRLILLNKGLFDKYPESWTLQTFAHESKHYLKDDNLVGWVVLTLILLAFAWLSDRSLCRPVLRASSVQEISPRSAVEA